MKTKVKVSPLNIVAICVLILVAVVAVISLDMLKKAERAYSDDIHIQMQHAQQMKDVEESRRLIYTTTKEIEALEVEYQRLIELEGKDTSGFSFGAQALFDGGLLKQNLDSIITTLCEMTQFHPDLQRTREDVWQMFLSQGIEDIGSAFTYLFYYNDGIYVNANEERSNYSFPFNEAIAIEMGNDNGNAAFYSPLYGYEVRILDGDKTHMTVLARIDYSVFSLNERRHGALPVVMILECSCPEDDLFNWKIDSIETHLVYGALVHNTEDRTYMTYGGKPLNIS